MHRVPEVLEAEAQVGKLLDCRARITSKDFAPLHSVKNGILQSACSTSHKMDADLGKSVRQRTKRSVYSVTMHVHARALVQRTSHCMWRTSHMHAAWPFWPRRLLLFGGSRQLFLSFLASQDGRGGRQKNGYRCTYRR